jgi:DNA-binding response OmpR family regulator
MTRATILIIDDEEPIRALLRFALEAAGYDGDGGGQRSSRA